jgi:hypothetical protein
MTISICIWSVLLGASPQTPVVRFAESWALCMLSLVQTPPFVVKCNNKITPLRQCPNIHPKAPASVRLNVCFSQVIVLLGASLQTPWVRFAETWARGWPSAKRNNFFCFFFRKKKNAIDIQDLNIIDLIQPDFRFVGPPIELRCQVRSLYIP